jgi:hypothetical protein
MFINNKNSPKERKQVYIITMLSVCGCHPFQLLNQVTDFHKTLYECHTIGSYPYIVFFELPTISNKNMVGTLTYELGERLLPLYLGS